MCCRIAGLEITQGMITDLTDLVDNPREAPDIELKQWLDLNDKVKRANLARHIAAISNHGGGYLVFGFCDDTSIDPNRPESLQFYSHDTINGIIKRYLSPSFDCHVANVESSGGQPIVWCTFPATAEPRSAPSATAPRMRKAGRRAFKRAYITFVLQGRRAHQFRRRSNGRTSFGAAHSMIATHYFARLSISCPGMHQLGRLAPND